MLPEPARVLLVDDNDAILARAAGILAPRCVIVGKVKDGRAALLAAAASRPDVIVLDISIPELTGLEVADSLRKAGSTAAVVFLTVHEEEEFLEAARAVGAIGYVVKSRLSTDLMRAVEEAQAGRPFIALRR